MSKSHICDAPAEINPIRESVALRRDKLGRIMAITGVDHTAHVYQMLYGKPGESEMERAFRRFPIDSHKPSW